MPPFYKHTRNDETSKGPDDIAKPGMRVDVNSVRRLLSTNDGSKAAKKCQKSFDAVFQAGRGYCNGKDSKFYSISKYTGMTEFMAPGKMKIIKHHSKSACEVKVPMYPKDEDAMNETLTFALSRDLLRKKFDSPEHCALWLFPYRTIVFKGLIKLKNWRVQKSQVNSQRSCWKIDGHYETFFIHSSYIQTIRLG